MRTERRVLTGIGLLALAVAVTIALIPSATREAIFNANLATGTIRSSVPLVLASLAGVVSERAGVVNLALEGILLGGAFFAMVGTQGTGGNLFLGLLYAVLSGVVLASLLGYFAIKHRADQVVTGVALNILASGGTTFLLHVYFHSDSVDTNTPVSPTVYAVMALALVALVQVVLYRTPLGLRIRAIGEHPRAADTLGINVLRLRYLAVLVSGILASLGGAYLSTGYNHFFRRDMSAGRGYIALAAMIFGKWTPLGALGASLFFGFADALSNQLQGVQGISIPPEFLISLPYILTLVALTGFIGRARPPAADGVPYNPQEGR